VGSLLRGDVIWYVFPSSKEGGQPKRRPCLVLASWDYGHTSDYLICMVSTKNVDPYKVAIGKDDILTGKLPCDCFLRPRYLVTVSESSLDLKQACQLSEEVVDKALDAIVDMLY
jgi:hypothetical protein